VTETTLLTAKIIGFSVDAVNRCLALPLLRHALPGAKCQCLLLCSKTTFARIGIPHRIFLL
jgi:hypothetical protein